MDSRQDTLFHIKRVNELLLECTKELLDRAIHHDDSKLVSPEVEYFDKYTEELAGLTYGTPEYEESLKKLDPALQHHYAKNKHHIEHWKDGIDDMDLFDLTELLMDWKASSERQLNGNLLLSLEKNSKRYGIESQLANILRNTIERHFPE